jgi:hypothetical protein
MITRWWKDQERGWITLERGKYARNGKLNWIPDHKSEGIGAEGLASDSNSSIPRS